MALNEINFKLFALEGLKSKIDNNAFESKSDMQFTFNVSFAHIYSERSLRITVDIEISALELKKVVSEFEMVHFFRFAKDTWKDLSDDNTKDVDLSKEVIDHLQAICIGSMRGYIFAKFEEIGLQDKLFLPLFNVSDVQDMQGYTITKD